MMKRLAAIFVFSVYLLGATDAYQVLKLPVLVNHFIEHSKESPNVTFISFLKMHYSDKIVIDNDFQQDMQLPFKTHENDCCLSIATVVPEPVQMRCNLPEEPVIQYTSNNENIPLPAARNAIFQPPRTA